jgi:prevent-host-death family protein
MRVGLREANQHFSRIVKAVRRGEEVLLTDRGRPIARITPLPPMDKQEAAIQRMIAQGLLRRVEKRGPMPPFKPIRIRGGPISKTISEERDER